MGAFLSASANPHLAVKERRRSSLDGTKQTAVKIAKDMKRLTTAAAKLKLKSKARPVTIVKSVSADAILEEKKEQQQPVVNHLIKPEPKPEPIPVPAIQRETRSAYKLSDLCVALGHYIQRKNAHLTNPSETIQWFRVADRALQLNGWTLSSFICESHIVFTYVLMRKALEMFECKNLLDIKQLFFMCLYISYTYNANEISYPLKPFLVYKDRVSFWDNCISLSMCMTEEMLELNQDHVHYCKVLRELRVHTASSTKH